MELRTKRASLPVALLLTAALLLSAAGCGTSSPGIGGSTASSVTESTDIITTSTEGDTVDKIFTLEDLGQFDGKDGRPAYIAVDGVVYDVSGSRSWPEGEHTRCNLGAVAGQDLSQELKSAPGGMRALVESLPVVGSLAQ
jgi:predicted heme/steroid binding protein